MLDLIAKLAENHGLFAGPALIMGWLIDRKATLRLAAKVLRAVAGALDAAPKVAEDAKAGNASAVIQDVRAAVPTDGSAVQEAKDE